MNTRHHNRFRTIRAIAAMGCLLAAAGCTAGPAPSAIDSREPRPPNPGPHLDAGVQLVPTNGAVVVVSGGRMWRVGPGSADLGHPVVVDQAPVAEAAAFASSGTLLYVASDDGHQTVISSSTDDGATWKPLDGTAVDVPAIGGLSVASLDGSDIAVLVSVEGGSGSSSGVVYVRTPDGWKRATAPSGGVIAAAGQRYWLIGGPSGNRLFVSEDGLEWKGVNLPIDAAHWTAGAPAQTTDGEVVVPITTHAGAGESELSFLVTADGGATWTTGARTTTPSTEIGTSTPTSITPGGHWVAAYPDGSRIGTGDLGTANARLLSPNGLAVNVSAVGFQSPDVGVAWSTPSDCPIGKASCSTMSTLSLTLDGGQTWAPLDQ